MVLHKDTIVSVAAGATGLTKTLEGGSMPQTYKEVEVQSVERILEGVVKNYGRSKRALIPALQRIQESLGYLPMWSLRLASNHLKVPLSAVYGVATFYHQFSLEPPGKYVIQICMGTACHIRGNSENYAFLLNLLGIGPNERTSKDGLFTVLKVRCLGCCSLAPVMKVNDDIYGKVDFKKIREIISRYRSAARAKRTSHS